MDDYYKDYCQDCKTYTSSVVDHSTGDAICIDCGLVLESHCVDEKPEWRTFGSGDDIGEHDPNRVGSLSNPLLNHTTLTTTISKPVKAKGSTVTDDVAISKNWMINRQSNPDRVLIQGFETIETMASKLSLVPMIKNRACEIYKTVQEQKSCSIRNWEAMSAACLFISCKENKLPRTLKEICSATSCYGGGVGVAMKDINKAFMVIKSNVELKDMTAGTMNSSELLVRRFCSNLGMKNHAMKAVRETLAKLQEMGIRRNPKSVLAAIIYIITQLSDEKKPLREVSMAADVAQGTIKKSFKDIYPHASRLIPNWFAKEEEIKRLNF